jgi:hypothetical protein
MERISTIGEGDHLLAKGVSQQRKELILRAFAYNIGRLETLFLLLLRVSTQPEAENYSLTSKNH